VLVVLAFGLGVGMIALGRLIGRRWVNKDFGRFHCPQCDALLGVGALASCPVCHAALVVASSEAKSVRPVMIAPRRMRTPAWQTLLWAVLWAVGTWAVLTIPWVVLFVRTGGDVTESAFHVPYEQVVLFPIVFVFLVGPPGWGIVLLFFSFHLIGPLATHALGDTPGWVMLVVTYLLTLIALTAHWYVGLRRWRRWLLLPAILAGANLITAVVGYFVFRD